MKNVVLLRKEAFGGTLFNSTTGKRIYINKQEYKELLTNNDLIYEFDIIDNKKKHEETKLKITENKNSSCCNMFSFADTVYIELTRKCNLF